MPHMEPSHFVASAIPNGFSWTLTTRLGDMLLDVESRYGPRDKTWTVLGVQLVPDIPSLWFPGDASERQVVINLNQMTASTSVALASFQLAHEVVHLLSPVRGGTNVLEEGVATVFAEEYMAKHFVHHPVQTANDSYIQAAAAVRKMLANAPDAVKALRVVQPSFVAMTQATFRQAGLPTPPALVSKLLENFERGPSA